MSTELRQIINSAADNIHDATRWDQRDEADEDGRTPMDRLVERIERLHGVNADDDERPNEQRLTALGFRVAGGIATIHREYTFVQMHTDGTWVATYEPGKEEVHLPNQKTIGDVRRLCAVLEIPLGGTQ